MIPNFHDASMRHRVIASEEIECDGLDSLDDSSEEDHRQGNGENPVASEVIMRSRKRFRYRFVQPPVQRRVWARRTLATILILSVHDVGAILDCFVGSERLSRISSSDATEKYMHPSPMHVMTPQNQKGLCQDDTSPLLLTEQKLSFFSWLFSKSTSTQPNHHKTSMKDSSGPCCDDIMNEIEQRAEECRLERGKEFEKVYSTIMAPKHYPIKPTPPQIELTESRLKSGFESARKLRNKLSPKHLSTDGVLFLDLDKCSIFGSDGNDLGIAMQWMNQSQAALTDLYRLLLNPCMMQAVETLKTRYGRVRVVLYTARVTLLHYHSAVRAGTTINIAWSPAWLEDGQLYIPPAAGAADIERGSAEGLAALLPDERDDVMRAVERLLATREAVRGALGLAANPDLVVTATAKDVARTARRLGHPPDHALLWDDNPRLRGEPGVLVVPPFDHLPPAQRRRLLAFLEERMPPASLAPDLVEFMMGAPPADRAVRRGPGGGVEYRLPECPAPGEPGGLEPWPQPPPPLAEEGWDASDVTPGYESSSPTPPPPRRGKDGG